MSAFMGRCCSKGPVGTKEGGVAGVWRESLGGIGILGEASAPHLLTE